MATKLDSVNIIGLRATHFEQLMNYVVDNEAEGYYYGNQKQFIQRHEDIKLWLEGVIAMARDSNNIIPKVKA